MQNEPQVLELKNLLLVITTPPLLGHPGCPFFVGFSPPALLICRRIYL